MSDFGLLSKAVFNNTFPLTAEFRSGPRNIKDSYQIWKESQPFLPIDLQTNVLRLAPENYAYANKFAAENPNLLMLSTWRAASGQPMGSSTKGDPLGVSTIEFPGHFVLSPGSTLRENLSASSKTVTVESGENMVSGPALLVKTKTNGEKIWNRYEYILIRRVRGNLLTIKKRAYNGSPPAQKFASGSTYVAPIPWDSRNREPYTDWFFNLSEFCPEDSNGNTAMDILLRDMVNPLARGGELENIGGLDLASGPLTVNPENADYNLDGRVDPSKFIEFKNW